MVRVLIELAVLLGLSFSLSDEGALIEALMDESLRSNRVQACDGERITLQCPKNTHIQRLSELCDKRRKCTIYVDATTFQEDPCPATSKYLQMSYKCKPVSFDGESFCGGTEMQLECREGRRLAVYSAAYGRTPRGQPSHCPMPPKQLLNKECTRDVLGEVVTRCHAQSGCSISISDRTLGKVCPPAVPSYLNIIFMCVNEEVFSEEAIKGELKSQLYLQELQHGLNQKIGEGSGESTDKQLEDSTLLHVDHSGHQGDEASFSTPPNFHVQLQPSKSLVVSRESLNPHNDASFVAEDLHLNSFPTDNLDSPPEKIPLESNALGVAHDIALIWTFLKQNKEKVLLCTVLSLSLALILLVLVCLLQQFLPSARREKDNRVRYSIERSSLINRNNCIAVNIGKRLEV